MMNKILPKTVALILLGLCLTVFSRAGAEWKDTYVANGNNCGLMVSTTAENTGGYSEHVLAGAHQWPRGSGNIYHYNTYNWGVNCIRDLDGDGMTDDTTKMGSRGGRMPPGIGALEFMDKIEAYYAAGEAMQSATNRLEANRIWVSTDPQDLEEWPVTHREGRSASGDPIVYGAQTIATHASSCWQSSGPTGASFEYRFYFLNYAESNDMVYAHIFVRNMSEYLKYSSWNSTVERYGHMPDGQTWIGWGLSWAPNNLEQSGQNRYSNSWFFHNMRGIFALSDADGVNPGFSGHPAITFHCLLRPPTWKGEQMDLSNCNTHGWSDTDWGIEGAVEILAGGHTHGEAYRMLKGADTDNPYYKGIESPWEPGKMLYGIPGTFEEDSEWYDYWVWGSAGCNCVVFYDEFHDFAPRDSCSFNAVLGWAMPKYPPFSIPPQTLDNLRDPGVQEQMEPVEGMVDVGRVVYEGNYVLPETPSPPPLTIIPGDKQVTISWSDVNVHTPDAYYYFLQGHPELDPEGLYREYDFEGYRLYRSYVGPSNSHAEEIFECNLTDQNLRFFYTDERANDHPLYRLSNGQKVWYALVPYDRNYNLKTGEVMSLPPVDAGKNWNRSGASGLYTVIPRSNASNFKPASGGIDNLYFVPPNNAEVVEAKTYELTGEGDGRLTQPPVFMPAIIHSIKFVPVINELLSEQKTINLVCSEVAVFHDPTIDWGCNVYSSGASAVQIVEASGASEKQWLDGQTEDMETLVMAGPQLDSGEGTAYGLEVTFDLTMLSHTDYHPPWDPSAARPFAQAETGGYTGGQVVLPKGGCWRSENEYRWSAPHIGGLLRTAVIEVEWVDNGDGTLSINAYDKTRDQAIPFGLYPDDHGWGFWTSENADGWDSPALVKEAVGQVPRSEREVQQIQEISSDNTEAFAIFVNGLCYKVVNPNDPDDDTGITMPSPGSTWELWACYGVWNEEQTVFTQKPDMPWLGDTWALDIEPMSLEPEDAELDKIRVVPNPYMANSYLDLSPASRRIEFVNLPDRCTIRIYSLGGVLVNVLNHIGSNRHGWGNYQDWDRLDANNDPMQLSGYDNHGGTEAWNLRNRFGQTVASGLYFFHVTDSRGEQYTGKFYVIN